MVELVICSREGRPLRRLDLSTIFGRLVIGRAEDCDLRIASPCVSRHHCALEQDEDGSWLVRDLGSTCGTTIDGARIEVAEVAPGLTVQVGPAVLKFEAVPATVR